VSGLQKISTPSTAKELNHFLFRPTSWASLEFPVISHELVILCVAINFLELHSIEKIDMTLQLPGTVVVCMMPTHLPLCACRWSMYWRMLKIDWNDTMHHAFWPRTVVFRWLWNKWLRSENCLFFTQLGVWVQVFRGFQVTWLVVQDSVFVWLDCSQSPILLWDHRGRSSSSMGWHLGLVIWAKLGEYKTPWHPINPTAPYPRAFCTLSSSAHTKMAAHRTRRSTFTISQENRGLRTVYC